MMFQSCFVTAGQDSLEFQRHPKHTWQDPKSARRVSLLTEFFYHIPRRDTEGRLIAPVCSQQA